MFSKRSLASASPTPASSTEGGLGALIQGVNPYVAVSAAGGLFLMAAATLVVVTGDPHAGAPRVRVALSAAAATSGGGAQSALAASGAAPLGQATITGGDLVANGPLLPAPFAGLTAPGPGGLLPAIGADGRQPWQAYARPFHDTGKPKVALVIGGLGLNATATRKAIEELPPEVTLSFVPYSEGLQGWIDLARQNGHEVLLETPMEPLDYPQNDPGPYTLMAGDAPAATVKRMEWLMSRATGYFGLTNYLGGKFLASDPAMSTFASVLRQRGLAFLDDGSAARRGGGVPRASADRIIDDQLDNGSIGQQLTALETAAQAKGQALGAGFAYPVTLEEVKRWAGSLSARGIVLAPASAVTTRRQG
jgi:polysaccharide deacetylase 2 family uncharacterized protein YibQ